MRYVADTHQEVRGGMPIQVREGTRRMCQEHVERYECQDPPTHQGAA